MHLSSRSQFLSNEEQKSRSGMLEKPISYAPIHDIPLHLEGPHDNRVQDGEDRAKSQGSQGGASIEEDSPSHGFNPLW